MSRQLPPHPSIKQLKIQAKDLLKSHQAGDPEAITRVKASFPRLSGTSPEEIRAARLCLRDAQLVVAREYGFSSWTRLAAALGESAKPPCSFCGRFEGQGQARRVIVGPGVRICDACVQAGQTLLRQGSHAEWETADDVNCSFCGLSSSRVEIVTRGDCGKNICARCLELCGGIIERQSGKRSADSPSAARSASGQPSCSICSKRFPEARVFDLPGGELWVCSECVDAHAQTLANTPAGSWKRAPEATCSLCRRNTSYGVDLAATHDGSVCLCEECGGMLQDEGKAAVDKQKAYAYIRKFARQMAEKYQAGDPEVIRRVEAALPRFRILSPEEVRRAPLDPEEAYHVIFVEFTSKKERALDDIEHTYVEAMQDLVDAVQDLTDGPPPRRSHRRFLEDQARKLVDDHRQSRPQAARRIKIALPHQANASLDDLLNVPFTREEAQTVIAREYGAKSWPELLARDEIGYRHRQVQNECSYLSAYASRIRQHLGHRYEAPEHVLLALIRGFSEEMAVVLDILGLDRQVLEKDIQDFFDSRTSQEGNTAYNLFPAQRLSTTTIRIAAEMHHTAVHPAHFLLALIEDPQSGAARILAKHGVDFARASQVIQRNTARLTRPESTRKPPETGSLTSDACQQVIQYASEESARLRHNYTDTEHLLLGILRDGNSKAIQVLTNLGIDLKALRGAIVDYGTPSGDSGSADDATPPSPGGITHWTPRISAVFFAAREEAEKGNPPLSPPRTVDVEHLLLGLMKDREGVGAQILAAFGVDYEKVREQTRLVLEEDSEKNEGKDEN